MSELTIDQIQTLIPHRYPFLFVDKVETYVPGKYIKAIKNVSVNEGFFQGHFPSFPVMPGVVMIEALSQAAAILLMISNKDIKDRGDLLFLTGVDKAKFKQQVRPGDVLELEVEFVKNKKNIWKVMGKASVAGKVVCQAEISCANKEVSK